MRMTSDDVMVFSSFSRICSSEGMDDEGITRRDTPAPLLGVHSRLLDGWMPMISWIRDWKVLG